MTEHRIKVDKYEFVTHPEGNAWKIVADGQTRVFQIDGRDAVVAMMRDLDAARAVVQAARETVEAVRARRASGEDFDPRYFPLALADALALHDRLTSDREPPSAWAGMETKAGPAFLSPSHPLHCTCGNDQFHNRSGNGRPNVYVCSECRTEHSWR